MKKLDLYIIRKFLGTFFLSILLLLALVTIFDISEKIDDFISRKAPLNEIIFDYYFNFLPYFANLFSPLFTFISVIFFTSKMAGNTEIVAILTSGVSFNRLLRPFFIAAFVIASISFTLNHWIIPHANYKRNLFMEKYIWEKYRNHNRHIHKQIEKGHFIYAESFSVDDKIAYKFSYEIIEGQKMSYKLNSDQANWDSLANKWRIYNYTIRSMDSINETLRTGAVLDTVFNFSANEFIEKREHISSLNYGELNSFIDKEKLRGSPKIPFYLLEKYRRTAFPFTTFIFTLIAVSLSSQKTRGGVGGHIGLGFLISFSFILFMQVFDTFATNANTPPIVAVWIPNLLFGTLAFYLYKKAPK